MIEGTDDLRFIHIGSGHRSRLVTLVHECHHFIVASHDELGEVFYIWPQARVLTDSQVPGILGIQ